MNNTDAMNQNFESPLGVVAGETRLVGKHGHFKNLFSNLSRRYSVVVACVTDDSEENG